MAVDKLAEEAAMTDTPTERSCPDAPHRGPQGPNEDVAVCPLCFRPSHTMRPWGETYGTHIPDCSLPIWHESYCKPGGSGHPEAPVIRGYWPEGRRD